VFSGATGCASVDLASSEQGRIPEAGVGKMGALQRAMQFIMQCIRGAAPRDTLCVIWELWA
jgi:hypothetical protein